MKSLWNKVFDLLRTHPRLWVPALAASGLSYVWLILRTRLNQEILHRLTSRTTSVLESVSIGHPVSMETLFIVGLLTSFFWACIDILCFVLAMLVTAHWLDVGQQFVERDDERSPSTYLPGAVWLTVLTVGLGYAISAVETYPISYLAKLPSMAP